MMNYSNYIVLYKGYHNFAFGLSSTSPIKAFVFRSTTEAKKIILFSFCQTAI